MAMSISVQSAVRLADGVWSAALAPADLQMLAGQPGRLGSVSVLLLLESPDFDVSSGTLSFSPSGTRVLNIGVSDSVVIVESARAGEEAAAGTPKTVQSVPPQGGDSEFLNSLPSRLSDFGSQLLNAVRASYPGMLRLAPKSGKFVETPDNFWTIRIQPRDESFRITLRGSPDDFSPNDGIRLVPDRTGYSALKLTSPAQITDFMKLLRQVPRKGRGR